MKKKPAWPGGETPLKIAPLDSTGKGSSFVSRQCIQIDYLPKIALQRGFISGDIIAKPRGTRLLNVGRKHREMKPNKNVKH